MSSKQITKKRGVVACNKCKRDKKKCDGSYLTQKPCKNCRDRNEHCEYIEPSRLKTNEMINISSSNIEDNNQYQDFPLRQNLDKSDIFLQLLTDPSTTNEQMVILKRLYNEIIRNPENPNFIGNKRDELSMKLKLLLSSSTDNDNTKIQIWDDLCSLVNELDNNINKNENNSNILDSIFNTWNSEPLEFSSSSSPITTTSNNLITTPNFSNDQLNVKTTTTSTTTRDKPKVRVIKENKKKNDIKKRKSRKNQRENKRTVSDKLHKVHDFIKFYK